MKKLILISLFFMCSLCSGCANTKTQNRPKPSRPDNTHPQFTGEGDGLVATDALGRTLPLYEEAGDAKEGKYVGVFYWLWHRDLDNSNVNPAEYDITKALRVEPGRTKWERASYYWGEPELGYYRSDDEYVMQKHLNLFTLMGIDFLYLDYTNLDFYDKELDLLLKLIRDMQKAGHNPPRVVLFLNTDPNWKIEKFYKEYLTRANESCWFYVDGKPLIICFDPRVPNQNSIRWDELSTGAKTAFTWRSMWGYNPGEEDESTWRYFDQVPQRPVIRDGEIEQVSIAPGYGAPLWNYHIYGAKSSTTTHAPTYNEYYTTEDTGKGIFFAEQWGHAKTMNAKILCITGWNEWQAGAWDVTPQWYNAGMTLQGRRLPITPTNPDGSSVATPQERYFVDEFNEEFNRDLEPQTGEYSDNYFYQMAAIVREFKGMQPRPKASAPKTISIDGDFEEWEDVLPNFNDFVGDAKERSSAGAPQGTFYANSTGRNDIAQARVTFDNENLYFYVSTDQKMTPCTDPNWMLIYLDTDRNKTTGWEGYDFCINMEVVSESETKLRAYRSGSWENVADCSFRVSGNQMEIAVPLDVLNMGDKPSFYFHIVDNIQKIDDITEFFVNGDSAPERRYNFFYEANN